MKNVKRAWLYGLGAWFEWAPQHLPLAASALVADDRFFAALLAADRAALARILSPDFLLIDVMTGSEVPAPTFLDVIGSGQLAFETIEPSGRRVRQYRDTAVVTGATQLRGRFAGTSFVASSRYTHVFVQHEGQWRLASAQGTPVAAPIGSTPP